MALALTGCAIDPNALYPDAGAGSLNSFLAQPNTPNQGPTVDVGVTYPNYASFGNFRTPDGKTMPLAASNQKLMPDSIANAVNDQLSALGFKLAQPSLFGGASRTLNITVSSLTFSYDQPNANSITATCVISLQAAAGTFDHMSKSYSSKVVISNNPAASQSQIIQAVGQALNNALQQMMSDQQLIQFIS
ncbi:MAG: putative lipoprotein [Gammaproteobacteria bacterium]|jgi:uncharacterized lipoprotein YajG|nr:putative lipoprotein [Gammaproteobacteria bacterium]